MTIENRLAPTGVCPARDKEDATRFMDPNPYDSPTADTDTDVVVVVDRAQRGALADAIRGFLAEEFTAFEFDDALDAFRDSADPTVEFVTGTVWYHYDDCTDHKVALSKPEWDYFQRLLLLLESDRQVAVARERRWSWTQPVAWACLAGFCACIGLFGWGEHLLAFSIPFGVVSMLISVVRSRMRSKDPYGPIITPFATFTDLSAVYQLATTFTKIRYPGKLAKRRIRSRVAEFGVRLQLYATWLMLSPIPLLVQSLPMTETRTRVEAA